MKKVFVLFVIIFYTQSVVAKNFDKCDFVIYNECIMCDEALSFEVGDEDTCIKRCPNREINFEGSGSANPVTNCALKTCPTDKPYKNRVGSCLDFKAGQYSEEDFDNLYSRVIHDDDKGHIDCNFRPFYG